jgi:hypothetical protein
MNGHLDEWIDGYLDGALSPEQKRRAEAHLAHCPTCHSQIEQRRALSILLGEAPAATGLKPEKQFAAEVGLQLARRQAESPPSQSTASLAWLLVPAGLLVALAIVWAAGALSTLLSLVPGLNLNLAGQLPLPQLPMVMPAAFSGLVGWLSVFDLIEWNWLSVLLAMSAISLVYLGWLAGWWAQNRQAAG